MLERFRCIHIFISTYFSEICPPNSVEGEGESTAFEDQLLLKRIFWSAVFVFLVVLPGS